MAIEQKMFSNFIFVEYLIFYSQPPENMTWDPKNNNLHV